MIFVVLVASKTEGHLRSLAFAYTPNILHLRSFAVHRHAERTGEFLWTTVVTQMKVVMCS